MASASSTRRLTPSRAEPSLDTYAFGTPPVSVSAKLEAVWLLRVPSSMDSPAYFRSARVVGIDIFSYPLTIVAGLTPILSSVA